MTFPCFVGRRGVNFFAQNTSQANITGEAAENVTKSWVGALDDTGGVLSNVTWNIEVGFKEVVNCSSQ